MHLLRHNTKALCDYWPQGSSFTWGQLTPWPDLPEPRGYVVLRHNTLDNVPCDFARLRPAAVWVRACRRHHLVPLEKFRLDSYFGCPARSSFRKNFPWLGQLVVERASHDETRIRLPIWVSSIRPTRVQSAITNSELGVWCSVFRIYPVSAKRSRAFQFRHLRSSDFDDGKLVQSNSFSWSISDGVFWTEYFSRSRSGVVIGMNTLDVIRASVRRRMTKCLLTWAYISWTSPTSLN